MGIFRKDNLTLIEKYIAYLKKELKQNQNENMSSALNYLLEIKQNNKKNPFMDDEILVSLIDIFITKDIPFEEQLNNAINVYKEISVFKDETSSISFIKLFENDGIIDNDIFSNLLYNLVESKKLYFEIMNVVKSNENLIKRFNIIEDYILNISSYITNEEVLKNDIFSFLNVAGIIPNINDYIEIRIKEAKERIGIYTVDEKIVSDIDKKIADFNSASKGLISLLETAEKTIARLNKMPEAIHNQIEDDKKRLQIEVTSFTNSAIEKLKEMYYEYLKEEKLGLKNESDEARNNLIREFDKRIRDLKLISDTISNNTSNEISRVNKFINEQLETLIKEIEGKANEIKIVQGTTISETKTEVNKVKEEGIQAIESIKAALGSDPEKIQEFMKKISLYQIDGEQIVSPLQSGGISNTVIEEKSIPVSKYLDNAIAYQKRIKELKEKMKILEDKGIIFHEKFLEVLSSTIEGDNPYLIGPSGCGKTYLVGMIAKLLQVPLVEIGRIVDGTTLIGFSNATGNLTPTNFFYCYKDGKIAFLDELDNGIPDATVTLNSFTSNKQGTSYAFPSNVVVKRHPNFRIIAAGNTSGNGANEEFNARGMIDESVQQRLTPIYIGYDGRIEKNILSSYPDWYGFVESFREVTDKWAVDSDRDVAPGVFTTRDASTLKQYLDNKSKTLEQIIECQFIQTKDLDYLSYLKDELSEIYKIKTDGSKQFKSFVKRVNEISSKNGRRY